MARILPPLSAVRAFEAAARHLSFTRAAEELGMTQAAVSYQIKVLEERAGTPLFLRRPRQVELTEAGRRLAPIITDAFERIAEGWGAARTDSGGVLTISTLLTFASNWLAQNIGTFQIRHPGIAVRLETSNLVVDFARENVDVAIRSGSGDWPGVESHFLFKAGFTPMLSPALARSAGRLDHPSDLMKLPLLDAGDPWWAQWFSAADVPLDGLAGQRTTSLGAQAYEAASAIAGNGVAILTQALFAAELASGRLVQPFDLVGQDGNAYWLVHTPARRNVPKIRAFREWILAEMERS